MTSLRALLEAMYTLLLEAFRGLRSQRSRSSRPVRGPALPIAFARAGAAPRSPGPSPGTDDRSPGPDAGLRASLRARAARPPLPPHLAAILASAPDVEPEFARLSAPRRAPTLLDPLRRIAARVRVYNPRAPITSVVRAAPRVLSTWAQRLRRAVSEIHAWLAFDTAPPSQRAVG